MLTVSNLYSAYGAIRAVEGLSLEVGDRQLVALLGANGAGKSTTMLTISGLKKPRSGTITLDGERIDGRPAHRLVRRGVALVPEGRMVVAPLTVAENLDLSRASGRGRTGVEDRVYALFPRLAERRRQVAGALSGGEQQMLAIGRALMTEPKLLLLDEPSMGLAPAIVDSVFDAIAQIHASGQSILLVEQNVVLALAVADRAYVMERGQIVIEGAPAEIEGSAALAEAYLG